MSADTRAVRYLITTQSARERIKKSHAIIGVAKLLEVRSLSSEARIVAGTTILPKRPPFLR